MQKPQMNETSQVSETTDGLTSMTSEDQDILFSATFIVKVGACQTFQEGEYSKMHKDTLREQMCVTSHERETMDNVTSANVSNLQMKQNGNKVLTERRPMRDRRTGNMYENRNVRFCNISDECRMSPNDFDRKDVLVWIFSFMAMMMVMMESCIGQWTCKFGEIFRKGTECCSKESEDSC